MICTLRINDVVEATFRADDPLEKGFTYIQKWVKDQFRKNPDKQELKLFFRVKQISDGNILLRPLHIAKEDGNTKSWKCGIGKFQQYQCRKVSVSAIGKF